MRLRPLLARVGLLQDSRSSGGGYSPRRSRSVTCSECTNPVPPRPSGRGGSPCKTCSKACQYSRHKKQVQAWRASRRVTRNQTPGVCPHCKTPFDHTRFDRVYCTRRCGKAAYRVRERRRVKQKTMKSTRPIPCATCVNGRKNDQCDDGYECLVARAGWCKPLGPALLYEVR